MKTYKECQCCGKPLKNDPEKGGTTSDGTKNLIYFSYWYKCGVYTQPDITVDEMKTFCKGKMKEIGFPGFINGFFTQGIPKLDCWKTK